jgi:hypothetical protein
LSVAVYQYAKELQSEFTSAAYSTSKPANGHSWSEMECPEGGLCVRGTGADQKVGIGLEPIATSKKFEVDGDIKASGDLCNGSGNCLSALATLTNACGGAATNYVYSASAFSGTYCAMGSSTPAAPSFPAAGASTTWTCPVANDPTHPISCTATHAAAPIAGVCGAAATSYIYSATDYSGALCSTGTASVTPAFPTAGSSSSWSCLGANGGASPSCTASRANPLPLVNSEHNEAQCVAAGGEVVASDVGYDQCRFSSASTAISCPSGWKQYKSYGDCGSPCLSNYYGSYDLCTVTTSGWMNNPTCGTCSRTINMCTGWDGCPQTYGCTAVLHKIGCY